MMQLWRACWWRYAGRWDWGSTHHHTRPRPTIHSRQRCSWTWPGAPAPFATLHGEIHLRLNLRDVRTDRGYALVITTINLLRQLFTASIRVFCDSAILPTAQGPNLYGSVVLPNVSRLIQPGRIRRTGRTPQQLLWDFIEDGDWSIIWNVLGYSREI
jgi:hypothetical protein